MNIRTAFLMLLIVLPALKGCQQEEDILKPPSPAEAFDTHSTTADLIRRATLLDGSADNILDSASCASMVLPVSVVVNGEEVVVNSYDDLKYVERLLDAVEEDDVTVIFPIHVVLADHSEVLVESEDALEALRDECEEGGVDDDIECVDFVYPLVLTIYNTSNEVADVIEINSDEALHNFVTTMEDDDLVSFKFPIAIRLSTGAEVIIHDNLQLQTEIQGAAQDCDEDDDTDFEDDDVDSSPLIAVLVNGSWKVDRFFEETDQTAQFGPYTFAFFADGSALAVAGTAEVQGTWAIYGDNGQLELELDFGEVPPFNEMKEGWQVVTFTETMISTKDDPGAEQAKELNFKKQ